MLRTEPGGRREGYSIANSLTFDAWASSSLTFDAWEDFEDEELIFQMLLSGELNRTVCVYIPSSLTNSKSNIELTILNQHFKKKYDIYLWYF